MSFFWARRGPSPSCLSSHPPPFVRSLPSPAVKRPPLPLPPPPMPPKFAPLRPRPRPRSAHPAAARDPPPPMGAPRARTRIRKRARGDGCCCRVPAGGRELALWSPNPPTLSPAGNSGPSRLRVLSDGRAMPCACPAPGLGLRAAGHRGPALTSGPARPGPASSGFRGRLGQGMMSGPRQCRRFNPDPGIKRRRRTDPFSHQLSPFPTSCPPRPPDPRLRRAGREPQRVGGWVSSQESQPASVKLLGHPGITGQAFCSSSFF